MICVAVVDDNERMLKITSDLIKKIMKADEEIVIFSYNHPKEFLKQVEDGKIIDIALLDIDMPEMGGMDLARALKEKLPKTYIIFLTSYSEFAASSYEIGAYQYILKKAMRQRIPVVLNEVFEKIKTEKKQYRIVGTITDQIKIYEQDIVSVCKAKSKKYVEYVVDKEVYRERITLEKVVEELNSKMFILVGRSQLINIKHIVRVKGNEIFMDNGDCFVVSRMRIAGVKEQINSQWREV